MFQRGSEKCCIFRGFPEFFILKSDRLLGPQVLAWKLSNNARSEPVQSYSTTITQTGEPVITISLPFNNKETKVRVPVPLEIYQMSS